MKREEILDKHLKGVIENSNDDNWEDFEKMKTLPEYKAVLDAMTELENSLVVNKGRSVRISGCVLNSRFEWDIIISASKFIKDNTGIDVIISDFIVP